MRTLSSSSRSKRQWRLQSTTYRSQAKNLESIETLLFCLVSITVVMSIYSFPTPTLFSYGIVNWIVGGCCVVLAIIRGGRLPIDSTLFFLLLAFTLSFTLAQLQSPTARLSVEFFSHSLRPVTFCLLFAYLATNSKRVRYFWKVFLTFGIVLGAMAYLDLDDDFASLLGRFGFHRPTDLDDPNMFALRVRESLLPAGGRLTLFSKDANNYASLQVLTLVAISQLLFRRARGFSWKALFPVGLFFSAVLFILATGSRGAYLQLLTALAFLFLLGRRDGSRRHQILLKATVPMVLIVLVFRGAIPGLEVAVGRSLDILQPIRMVFEGPTYGAAYQLYSDTDTFTPRVLDSVHALDVFLKAGVTDSLLGFYGRESEFSIYSGSHNGYLNWLLEYGLVTFLAFMMVVSFSLFRLLKLRRPLLARKPSLDSDTALVNLGIMILLVYFTKMLVAPTGSVFWSILGLIFGTIRFARLNLRAFSRKVETPAQLQPKQSTIVRSGPPWPTAFRRWRP